MFVLDNTNILCDGQNITGLYNRNKVVGTTILQYRSEALGMYWQLDKICLNWITIDGALFFFLDWKGLLS